jgi:hypothetical protein
VTRRADINNDADQETTALSLTGVCLLVSIQTKGQSFIFAPAEICICIATNNEAIAGATKAKRDQQPQEGFDGLLIKVRVDETTTMTLHLALAVLISLGASCTAFQMLPAGTHVSHYASDRFTTPASSRMITTAPSQQQQRSSRSHGGHSSTHLSMGLLDDFIAGGDKGKRKADNEKYLATLQERVARINGLEARLEELGDDELAAATPQFRQRLQNGEALDGPILEQAFAVVREAAWYVAVVVVLAIVALKLKHF